MVLDGISRRTCWKKTIKGYKDMECFLLIKTVKMGGEFFGVIYVDWGVPNVFASTQLTKE